MEEEKNLPGETMTDAATESTPTSEPEAKQATGDQQAEEEHPLVRLSNAEADVAQLAQQLRKIEETLAKHGMRVE